MTTKGNKIYTKRDADLSQRVRFVGQPLVSWGAVFMSFLVAISHSSR